jgi:hypothetical protein
MVIAALVRSKELAVLLKFLDAPVDYVQQPDPLNLCKF